MRILHVIRTLNPSSGGPPRVAARLAAGQAALGHQVRIVSHRITDPREDLNRMTRLLPGFDRVEMVELTDTGTLEHLLAHQARPTLRRLINDCDVVHLHDVWDSLVRTAASLARRAGKPYVLQPNDSLNPWALSQKRWKKTAALAFSYRRMIEGSAAILFGHTEEQRLVSQHGFRIHPVVAGLGGVYKDEIELSAETGQFYRRYPQLRGRPFVVFLSRLHPKKGLDFLAEGFAVAAAVVPDLQLVIIGHDEGAQSDFESRIARHHLTDRVHVMGPMHGTAKWAAYRDAVCFCLPSRDEAFTVAIHEALSCGLPVVISEACHFDEVEAYGAGFVVPLEANRLGQALIRLSSDRTLREEMSRAARRLFEAELSFDPVPQHVIDVYEGCLARPRKAGGRELETLEVPNGPEPGGTPARRHPAPRKLRILVNAANIRTGGGVQKAVEFVRASIGYETGHEFAYALSDVVVDNLKRLVDVGSLRLEVATVSAARPLLGRGTRKMLDELENSFQPDVVFSVFGPAYHVFHSPHLMGFAVGWITHPNRHAWGTLEKRASRARMWAWCRYVEFWTRFADRWVLETSLAADGLARVLGQDRDRFRVVPNVCGEQYHQAAHNGNSVDERFRKSAPSDVNLLVFSAWYPHKNLEFVPAVAAELKKRDPHRRYRFFLTFDRSSPAWARIERDATRLGVENSVVNVGPIRVTDGPAAYLSSDALFLPTVLETFTASYPEAMIMGRPIVTSDLPFARDLCGEAALYFTANNAASAAETIVRLANDDALRQEMAGCGRRRATGFASSRDAFEMVIDTLELTARMRGRRDNGSAQPRWALDRGGSGN